MNEKSTKFGVVKKIVLATFSEGAKLAKSGIVCISAIGKPYDAEKQKFSDYFTIEGIQTNYAMFLHGIRVKDYKAAYMLYLESLNKVGKEVYIETIDAICDDENTDTIAFIGSGYLHSFDYRWILADYFKDCGVRIYHYENGDFIEIDEAFFEPHRKIWSEDVYQQRGHFNLDNEAVGLYLEKMSWNFAKTMPKNPHFWSVRRDFGDNDLYLKIVKHIRCLGEMVNYGGMVYRVFYYNGWRYWTMPSDIRDEDCDLINRQKEKL